MSSAPLPVRILAGVEVPDTPLITASIALARKHLDDMSFNHVMRSFILGFAVADKMPPFQSRDKELHAVAAVLHDLAWATADTFTSPDKRFEVDGANAARAFVIAESTQAGEPWNKYRLQLLWDAIALHTTPSIGQHKEPEVGSTGIGIFVDFRGPDAVPGTITSTEWDEIVSAFPRSGFREGVTRIVSIASRNICMGRDY
jgi:hypothetical protein